MQDIISQILERRKRDVSEKGFCMGCTVREERTRPVVPFMTERGIILEIKRASPSKGDIAPNLDAAAAALSYVAAGAKAISVLTEEHWFKGSLYDLIAAANAAGEKAAVLRKDFLYHPDEVDISYLCGADAVLVIARMLDEESMQAIIERTAHWGMSALIELRTVSDVQKASNAVYKMQGSLNGALPNIVYGVNARDLKDFSIDLLQSEVMMHCIQSKMPNARVITESGVLTPRAANIFGGMGFHGLLMGEAAAKNPDGASSFVESFASGAESRYTKFYHSVAQKLSMIRNASYRPLIKICGLKRVQDAVEASAYADFLGFVFWQKSKRCASQETVKQVRMIIDSMEWAAGKKPLLVGVVADKSLLSQTAISLAHSGVLDAVQFHNCCMDEVTQGAYDGIGHYAAVSVGGSGDTEKMRSIISAGEMRVLCDAKTEKLPGGTGVRVKDALCKEAAKIAPLWLAGGITIDNVSGIVKALRPELLDVASGVESSPGVKSIKKVETLVARSRSNIGGEGV